MDSLTVCHRCTQVGQPFPSPLWPRTINVFQCSGAFCYTVWGECRLCSRAITSSSIADTRFLHLSSRKAATQHCSSKMHRNAEAIEEDRLARAAREELDTSPLIGCQSPIKRLKPTQCARGSFPWTNEIIALGHFQRKEACYCGLNWQLR